jgi:hypothetical protein
VGGIYDLNTGEVMFLQDTLMIWSSTFLAAPINFIKEIPKNESQS